MEKTAAQLIKAVNHERNYVTGHDRFQNRKLFIESKFCIFYKIVLVNSTFCTSTASGEMSLSQAWYMLTPFSPFFIYWPIASSVFSEKKMLFFLINCLKCEKLFCFWKQNSDFSTFESNNFLKRCASSCYFVLTYAFELFLFKIDFTMV